MVRSRLCPLDPLTELLTMPHWALSTTVRCQQRCVYCFEGSRDGLQDVDAPEVRALLEAAARHVPLVVFMGSEPTLNPDLLELTRYASDLGLLVAYSTNALRLADAAYLDACRAAGLYALEISFPYPDADTFAAITRSPAARFDRLVTALENIDRLNAAGTDGPELAVNVNVVVSAFNVHRLPEVLARVEPHLSHTPHLFTLKGVLCPTGREEWFARHVHVPVATLRDSLADLFARRDPGTRLCFRGLPLCVLPDPELDGERLYHQRVTEVRCNFTDQREMRSMTWEPPEARSHPYDWLCALCTLADECRRRDVLREGAEGADNRPIPFLASPPAVVGAAGASTPEVASLLAALWREVPPAAPDGLAPGARWEPLRTGIIELRSGERRLRVALGAPRPHWRSFWTAGAVAVAPISAGGEPEASGSGPPPEVEALRRVLADLPDEGYPEPAVARALRAISDAFPVSTAHGGSVVPRCRGRFRGDSLTAVEVEVPLAPSAPPVTLEVEIDRQGERAAPLGLQAACVPASAEPRFRELLRDLEVDADPWRAVIAGPLLQRAAARLRGAGLAALAGGELVGAAAHTVVIRLDDGEQLRGCAVQPVGEEPEAGYLCGALRLVPRRELWQEPGSARTIQALGRACAELQSEGEWPALPPFSGRGFLAELWERLGPALLPSAATATLWRGGTVAARALDLRFAGPGGQELRLLFHPARGEPCFRRVGWLELSFRSAPEEPLERPLARLLEAYGERFAAPRRSRLPRRYA